VQIAGRRDSTGNVFILVEWMKNGEDGKIASRIETIEVGTNRDGVPITSCAVVPADDATAAGTGTAKPPRVTTKDGEQVGAMLPGDESSIKITPLESLERVIGRREGAFQACTSAVARPCQFPMAASPPPRPA
jgi:hypothetical protein